MLHLSWRSRPARAAAVVAVVSAVVLFALNPHSVNVDPGHGHVVLGGGTTLERAQALAAHLRGPAAHPDSPPETGGSDAPASPLSLAGGDDGCGSPHVLSIEPSNGITGSVAGTGAAPCSSGSVRLSPPAASSPFPALAEQPGQGLTLPVQDPPPRAG
jgi:hypothetical protein